MNAYAGRLKDWLRPFRASRPGMCRITWVADAPSSGSVKTCPQSVTLHDSHRASAFCRLCVIKPN